MPGRVNARGFLLSVLYASKYRIMGSSNLCPTRPEEVFFR